MDCKCGCGKKFTPSRCTLWRLKRGQNVGYLPGHAHRGENNPRWSGGKAKTETGYILVAKSNHINARKSGYILEHRLVMSEHLGRPLNKNEDVHHINGIKTDNRLENLILLIHKKHVSNHGHRSYPMRQIQCVTVSCLNCGRIFKTLPGTIARPRRKYCSKECQNKNQRDNFGANTHISPAIIKEIRALFGKMSHRKIAAKYKISKTHIGRILRFECR